MQTSHERRGGHAGGGGEEERREGETCSWLVPSPAAGPGLRAPPRCGRGALPAALEAALIAPSPPSSEIETPSHSLRCYRHPRRPSRPPRAPPSLPTLRSPLAGAFHARFYGKRMPARRRARREGGGPGGAAGSREKSAALRQGWGQRWLPRPTETICLLQMVWKVIKVGACMKIIDNV